MNFRKPGVEFTGGAVTEGQSKLPVSASHKSATPSPKITAAFPFLNISADICHSFDRKQFANKPEIKKKQGSDPTRVKHDRYQFQSGLQIKRPFLHLDEHWKSIWMLLLINFLEVLYNNSKLEQFSYANTSYKSDI